MGRHGHAGNQWLAIDAAKQLTLGALELPLALEEVLAERCKLERPGWRHPIPKRCGCARNPYTRFRASPGVGRQMVARHRLEQRGCRL